MMRKILKLKKYSTKINCFLEANKEDQRINPMFFLLAFLYHYKLYYID